jgi:hypothetical protein
MAGLAEAAWVYTLMICWGCLLVIAAITAAAYVWRSAKMAVCAIILLVPLSLFFRPWTAFPAMDGPEAACDPDVIYLNSCFEFMASFWGVEALAALASVPGCRVLIKRDARASRMRADAQRKRIDAFWEWFRARERELRCTSDDSDALCNELLRALQQVDEHLYFEIWTL